MATDGATMTEAVRERYATAARSHLAGDGGDQGETGCCDSSCCHSGRTDSHCCGSSCCGGSTTQESDPVTRDLYDPSATPSEGALAASLGCGNPTALADLAPGMDVLDLGSGGGLDVLLSARRVGPDGTAYGVDMTQEMLDLAERHKAEAGVTNATFLRGAIEAVPLPDAAVDVVISNCVINLSADKDAVLAEARRVLRPGGRFAVSDIVLLRELEPHWADLVALWTGCIAGALRDRDYVTKLAAAGFAAPSVEITRGYTRDDLEDLAARLGDDELPTGMTRADAVDALDGAFASAFIRATKPGLS